MILVDPDSSDLLLRASFQIYLQCIFWYFPKRIFVRIAAEILNIEETPTL